MIVWMLLSCLSAVTPLKDSAILEACRPEDGLHRCSEIGKCRNRSEAFEEVCETGEISCSNDEVRCRVTRTCIQRSLVGTENGCVIDDKSTRLPCRSDEFTCWRSGVCIPRYAVGDGKYDCNAIDVNDETDEQIPFANCNDDEFRCDDGSERCIPREWVLDGSRDCLSGADEREPLQNCNMNEHRCGSGRCIMRYRVYDGYRDCRDGSDELRSYADCREDAEFRCEDTGRCIPRSWMMDEIANCGDRSDEDISSNYACAVGEFRCGNGRRCIPSKYLCDGINHCKDCSDEIEACDIPQMWRLPGNTSICIPKSFGCNAFSDCLTNDNPGYLRACGRNAEETKGSFCNIHPSMIGGNKSVCEEISNVCFVNSEFTCAKCVSDNSTIRKTQLCDGAIDCRDLTDECLCNSHDGHTGMKEFCSSICYDSVQSKACNRCKSRQLFCPDEGLCVDMEKICDGMNDCPISQLDEKLCAKQTSAQYVKPHTNFDCWKPNRDSINLLRQLNITDSYKLAYVQRAIRCDGVFECGRFEDECNAGCPIESEICSRFKLRLYSANDSRINESFRICDAADESTNGRIVFGKSICDGVEVCFDKSDEENCPERTTYSTVIVKKKITIHSNRTCGRGNEGLNDSTVMNCTSSSHFYCTTASPALSWEARNKQAAKNCSANYDGCDGDLFSSDTEMISSGLARALIWIMALVSIVGNALVLHKEYLKWPQYDYRKRRGRILRINIAISSLGMGVALVALSCKSLAVSGRYCMESKYWRTSGSCNALGVLFFVLAQVSIFSLLNQVCFRLHGYFFPFKSRNLPVKAVLISSVGTWIASVFISIVPYLIQSIVSDALISPSSYYDNTMVSWSDYQTFAQRIFTLATRSQLQSDLTSWSSVTSALDSSYKDVVPDIQGFFGYYSAHGVCIPNLVERSEISPLSLFTVTMLSINLSTLVFDVVVSGVILFRLGTKQIGETKPRRLGDAAFRRQLMITTLMSANLCCWMPICIMAFASKAGVCISASAYAAGTMLIPLASGLSAVIYSAGFARERKALRKSVSELRRKHFQ